MNKIYDLFIKGGTVWTTSGPSETDVAVKNGIIHSIECVMFVQPSDTDSRLDLETQNKFSLTSCCMRTDLEVNSFLGDVK